jgi:hypothetical protein
VVTLIGLALTLVANLASATVAPTWRWWAIAVWAALALLAALAVWVQRGNEDGAADGAVAPQRDASGAHVVAHGDRSVAIGGHNRGTVVTGDTRGATQPRPRNET